MAAIDVSSLSVEDVSKLHAIIQENTEIIEKVKEMLSMLQSSPRTALAFMVSDTAAEITTMTSLIESLETENAAAKDMIEEAGAKIRA